METKKRIFRVTKSIVYAFFTIHFSLFTLNCFSQTGGAAINTTGSAAHNSAMLDVSSTNQGIRIPRLALTSATSASPISSPANKLIVYNTNTSMTGGNGAGIYIYDSTGTTTGKWIYLAAPSNGPGTSGQVLTSSGSGAPTWMDPAAGTDATAWHITGNASIDSSANFIGTTDASGSRPLRIKTRNTDRMIISSNGNVGIGTTSPNEKLEVVGNIISKGTSWTIHTIAVYNWWRGITYGNGLFVAVAFTGTGNRVMTSPDGINWTIRTSATDNSWQSVTYGNGLFVAVSYDGAGNRVMTSPDGITWTSRTSAADNGWQGVTYGNGLFVAVATTGNVMTSPDGINWTIRTSASGNQWSSVTYGNGLFVAVAYNGTGNRVMTSPDGITWTSRTSAADNNWQSIIYGNGLFVAVANTGSGNRVMTSPNGINWTSRTSAADNFWNSVTYGNGLFVAVANNGTGNRVMTSPDGINWTIRASAADNQWYGVTYGNGIFVAISIDGNVMTSGKSDYIPFSANNTYQGGMNIFGNVGIGKTNPQKDLQIQNSGNTAWVDISNSTAGSSGVDGLNLIQASNFSIIENAENGYMEFRTNGQSRMRVSATGGLSLGSTFYYTDPGEGSMIIKNNVGIGMNAPASLLHSAGQIRTGIPSGGLGGASATTGSLLLYNSTNTNTVTIQPGTTSTSYTLTLPASQGASSTNLQNDGAGNLIWATPGSTPTLKISDIMNSSSRYTPTNAGSGSAGFQATGMHIDTYSTAGSYAKEMLGIVSTGNADMLTGSPIFSTMIVALDAVGTLSGSAFFGIGSVPVDGTGHNFNFKHVGFKVVKVAGACTLYATQADGTTEQSAALSTDFSGGSVYDLIVKLNGTTSASYYWRKNGGALSAVTTLTGNMPTTAYERYIQWSVSNNSTAARFYFSVGSFSYER
ncbi:MAG: hypothetical protein HGB12_04230 [Bacteroidetes bacterium]|nr:hypothetical protein [Bacteroidota bacterium]